MKNICPRCSAISKRLRAPIMALERAARGKPLPRIFAQAAMDELKDIRSALEACHHPNLS